MTLTDRQRCELISLAGYPPVALDDEAAEELEALGLIRLVPQPLGRARRYRFTPAGKDALPVEQHARLAETERIDDAITAEIAKLGFP